MGRQSEHSRRKTDGGQVGTLGRRSPSKGAIRLTGRYLLDTHVLVRWFADPKKLSREQLRVLRSAVRQCEQLAVSAMTLLELALLFGEEGSRLKLPAADLLGSIESDPIFCILPIDVEVAAEVAAMGDSLRDPADRAIVATARVHGLRLVTSDQRIIESKLIPVVE
jgi:PIN domain nuclease of toxin-antitoxin system